MYFSVLLNPGSFKNAGDDPFPQLLGLHANATQYYMDWGKKITQRLKQTKKRKRNFFGSYGGGGGG